MAKFCVHCGHEVNENAAVCLNCGCAVQTAKQTTATEVDESVSAGLVVLSGLIPLFGIIYWLVKAKSRPKCANACGIAAIISWVVWAVLMAIACGL